MSMMMHKLAISFPLIIGMLIGMETEGRELPTQQSTEIVVPFFSNSMIEQKKWEAKKERPKWIDRTKNHPFFFSPSAIVHEERFNDGFFDTFFLNDLPQSGFWQIAAGTLQGEGLGERLDADHVKVYVISGLFAHRFSNFELSCKTRYIRGSENQTYGILFRENGESLYLFGITRNGYAHLFKNINRRYYDLSGYRQIPSDTFKRSWNTLEVRTVYDRIEFYVNDHRMGYIEDLTSLCGYIGLFVSYDVTAVFDDVTIETDEYCDPLTPTPTNTLIPTRTPTFKPTPTYTPTTTPTTTPTATPVIQELFYFFDGNKNWYIEDEEILLLQEYWIRKEPLPPILESDANDNRQTYFFDHNKNNRIEDVEILLLFNYWAQERRLPSL